MYEVIQTDEFADWFFRLKDGKAQARVHARIDRLVLGNPGDVRPIGSGVSEMRIDYGPGYRVYFMRRDKVVIVLLAGGDKRTQRRDIAKALALAERERE
ncbi:MAG: type II toxin-antitoxin system RelE/ParE family toxin [Alphaproteobacteria bacterium]|nr:type II toxin-antitoxin system RelE/ParE family toxin [Alphaproteobacteria bacterium]OJU56539.1 MAG: addiction module antitoxin RelB [Alphaproteobacteria bacterium 62-8]MBN9556049.1 type II toxin-antitoxin system RelE/ParE family toxin [Alphaproteobacteria bacterium]MBN9569274.1 type II toxin-antitoxin system RelE/ParE family toxin [Alphaproteobacteria bacterium]MBN9570545.1 type II toxin-antitoxin system RelE/ParE family toxin [Alphaproteobacteria bacterium]